ncbi:MAG: PEP/pyruvate-binding domain-containing protein [Eubacteriales bacterium]|jgi:pyruvate,water dikinase|nr:PEP/pyruvate-binding domain-containing protein [Eubacteriales bacterium]
MKGLAWFDEIPDEDLALAAGGKGASLCRMFRAGLKVPEGFIVRSEMFTEFMKRSGLREEILADIKKIDFDSTTDLIDKAEKIREKIYQTDMPKDMADGLREYYAKFEGSPVAVRSSGTAEDLDDASFAGQQETYLFVIGEDALIKYVKECWASLYNDRAIFYRREKNFDEAEVSIAVVVQKMVNAEKAGVLFTVNPVTKDPDVCMIEAAWGLGEAVVSGIVTPDNIWINKKTNEIVTEYISEKETMVVRKSAEGGTVEQDVPAELREKPVLSDEDKKALVDVANRIEDFYGKPEDVEWAFENGRLYMLQSRPITTL